MVTTLNPLIKGHSMVEILNFTGVNLVKKNNNNNKKNYNIMVNTLLKFAHIGL